MLVVWGKYDPSFTVAGATAYAGDVPKAEIHILDAGHFALDEATDETASLVRSFLEHLANFKNRNSVPLSKSYRRQRPLNKRCISSDRME